MTDHKHPITPDTWGQKGHLTTDQEVSLKAFTERAQSSELQKAKFHCESEESVSLRFLRARNFVVENSLVLLHDCVRRKEDGRSEHYASLSADECVNCDMKGLKKWYPHELFGLDKYNRPVLYEHSGGVEGNAIHQMTTTKGLINYHWLYMESYLNDLFTKAKEKDPNASVSTFVITDLTGLNMHHTTAKVVDHVKAMIQLDNTCYPEILGKMVVINAPWLAVTLWEMVKGWLDPRTQNKIEFISPGPEVNKRLLEFVDPDVLPEAFGGKAFNMHQQNHRPHTDYVHIPRSSAVKKQIIVPANSKLAVETYTLENNCDISLKIYRKPLPVEATSVIEHTVFTTTHSKHAHDVISNYDCGRILNNFPTFQLLVEKDIKINHTANHPAPATTSDEGNVGGHHYVTPTRTVFDFATSSTPEEYIVTWNNTAMFVTRPLTYNLIIEPTAGETTQQ